MNLLKKKKKLAINFAKTVYKIKAIQNLRPHN